MPTYFRIPFNDKNAAKALGARWSKEHELWYAEQQDVAIALASRWTQTEPLTPIEVFPGEDRLFGEHPKLAVDLIPSTCWFTNVRSCVSKDDWKRISMGVKRRAGKTCELCGGLEDPASGVFLEPHERFSYEDDVQTLRRLVCICSTCHLATHFGHAQATGQEEAARLQLAKVNAWDGPTVERHIREAFELWSDRSRDDWLLDLGIIEHSCVNVLLPSTEQRQSAGVNLNVIRPKDGSPNDFLDSLGLSLR